MEHESDIGQPSHCFCEIPEDELRVWAKKRYQGNTTTMELIQSVQDEHTKEVIRIVAMLDVDEKIMLKMMGNVNKPEHHIIHCREKVKDILGLCSFDPEE